MTHHRIDGILKSRADIGIQDGNGVLGAVPDDVYCDFFAEDLSVVSISCVNVELIDPYSRHGNICVDICVLRIESYSWNTSVDRIFISGLR